MWIRESSLEKGVRRFWGAEILGVWVRGFLKNLRGQEGGGGKKLALKLRA